MDELIKKLDQIRGEKAIAASVLNEEATDAMTVVTILQGNGPAEEKIAKLEEILTSTTSHSICELLEKAKEELEKEEV